MIIYLFSPEFLFVNFPTPTFFRIIISKIYIVSIIILLKQIFCNFIFLIVLIFKILNCYVFLYLFYLIQIYSNYHLNFGYFFLIRLLLLRKVKLVLGNLLFVYFYFHFSGFVNFNKKIIFTNYFENLIFYC